MIQVKICGIQQPEHALAAADAGADYIGLIFVPRRRRRVEVEAAREIISALKVRANNSPASNVPKVVGLFVDQSVEEVNHIVKACGLDLVQLCGHESLDYCQQMQAHQVIKVLHVPSSGAEESTDLLNHIQQKSQKLRAAGYLVTLDRLVDGLPGGTGQSFDWGIAAQLSQKGHEFLLAGGLNPENVAQAVAQVHPWGVDVSSGVETDEVKDLDKIREFVKNARRAGG